MRQFNCWLCTSSTAGCAPVPLLVEHQFPSQYHLITLTSHSFPSMAFNYFGYCSCFFIISSKYPQPSILVPVVSALLWAVGVEGSRGGQGHTCRIFLQLQEPTSLWRRQNDQNTLFILQFQPKNVKPLNLGSQDSQIMVFLRVCSELWGRLLHVGPKMSAIQIRRRDIVKLLTL